MPISITNLSAEFAVDTYKKVELEFGGGQEPNREGIGRKSAESDAVRGNGGRFNFPDQSLDLKLDSSNTLVVVAKVSKTLLPDKTIGEGRVQLTGDGQQQVQVTDPKTGASAGVVYFTVTSQQGALGRAQQAVTGNPNAGYGNTPAGAGGAVGTGTGAGYGAGQQTGGYGNNGTAGVGNTGGGQLAGVGGSGVPAGAAGGGFGGAPGTGVASGQGAAGVPGQEIHEKKSHQVSDHNETENYSRDVV